MHRTLAPTLLSLALGLTACGEDKNAQLLAGLQEDLRMANASIDSLNFAAEAANQLIDQMRAQVDSSQQVNEKLLSSVQQLNREVRQWRELAGEQQRLNQQMSAEIERMKREKQADQQAIGRLRAQSDSLSGALLVSHNSLRRQSDQIRRLESQLEEARKEVAGLQKEQASVRLRVGSEDELEQGGYVEVSRPFGRASRKAYKLVRKIDPSEAQLVAMGEGVVLDKSPRAVIDRYGRLKEGQDYRESKEGDRVRIIFTNDMLIGTDVVVLL